MNLNYFLLLVFLNTSLLCFSQKQILYKQINSDKLFMEIYYPEKFDTTKKYPAMVFIFGGGWVNGNRYHFLNQAKYFSKRGLVCFLIDYRTKSTSQTTPFECLKDAKSAIRFIRGNAPVFHIDETKIIAAGGSSGGHLAAATALIDDYNEKTDDLSVSCIPNALVLFNPVIDNGPGGYGFERIGDQYKSFSPLHNIRKYAPPTIIMLGTKDKLIPVETAKYYQKVMEKVGSRCDLKLYEGEPHGFFSDQRLDNYEKNYKKTILDVENFLQSIEYLVK